MNIENGKSLKVAISIMFSLIVSNIVRSFLKINYNMFRDGLDFRILISFLIFIVLFFIFYFFIDKLFFYKSNKSE